MGKIWDSITAKPASNSTIDQPRKIGETPPAAPDQDNGDRLQTVTKAAGYIAAVLLVVSIVWVFTFAWINVRDLFAIHMQAQPFTATLAAGSSVGMLAVLLLVTFGIKHNRMRGLATLYAAGWFGIVVSLVAIKTLFDATVSDNENLKGLATNLLNTAPWLENFGSVLAAILAGLCIAPVASMFGAAKHTADDMTEDEARARYAWNAGKLIISGASIGLAVMFGVQVIGINPFIAVLLGLVLDLGFIVALQKAESSASAGDHRQAGTWSKFVWVYGVLIALMAVETIPALARMMGTPVDVPGVTDNALFHSLGRIAYIGAIGMGILTIVLTATSGIRQKRDAAAPAGAGGNADARPFGIRTADAIRGTRAGIAEVKAALRDGKPAPAQLTAGMAADGDGSPFTEAQRKAIQAALMEETARLSAGKAEPVKGKDYDTTGIVVTPADDEELRRAHRKWVEDNAKK
jgi:hypothetical protein